jgi:hypothetical protein
MTTSTLGFTVRIALDRNDLKAACAVRSEAYGRHIPGLRKALEEPDAIDQSASAVVLICEDKASGGVIGTARVQTGSQGPLLIEECVALPALQARHGRAEVSRIATLSGADVSVKVALWKASYLYCIATQSRWMIIGARNEALVRQYRRLGFEALYPDSGPVPLHYAGGLPHHVLTFDTYAAERTWKAGQHGLYDFVFETHHPDIQLYAPKVARRTEALAA